LYFCITLFCTCFQILSTFCKPRLIRLIDLFHLRCHTLLADPFDCKLTNFTFFGSCRDPCRVVFTFFIIGFITFKHWLIIYFQTGFLQDAGHNFFTREGLVGPFCKFFDFELLVLIRLTFFDTIPVELLVCFQFFALASAPPHCGVALVMFAYIIDGRLFLHVALCFHGTEVNGLQGRLHVELLLDFLLAGVTHPEREYA